MHDLNNDGFYPTYSLGRNIITILGIVLFQIQFNGIIIDLGSDPDPLLLIILNYIAFKLVYYLIVRSQFSEIKKIHTPSKLTAGSLKTIKSFYIRYKTLKKNYTSILLHLLACFAILIFFLVIYFAHPILGMLIFFPALYTCYLITKLYFVCMIHLTLKFLLLTLRVDFHTIENYLNSQHYAYLRQKNPIPIPVSTPNLDQEISRENPPSRNKTIHLERPVRIVHTQHHVPDVKPELIDPNDFVQQLNLYIQNTHPQLLRHTDLINHLLDIFQEIKRTPQQYLTATQKQDMVLFQRECLKNLQQDITQYLAYPLEVRQRYDQNLQSIPELWLTKQLQSHIEQLTQNIASLYENNLQALLDHQTLLEQKFNDKDDAFQSITQDHPHKN